MKGPGVEVTLAEDVEEEEEEEEADSEGILRRSLPPFGEDLKEASILDCSRCPTLFTFVWKFCPYLSHGIWGVCKK